MSTNPSEVLAWIDDFWPQISDLVMIREEDDILILPPNRVYKLNETAKKLLDWLQAGHKISDISTLSLEQVRDVDQFFAQIARAMKGENPSCKLVDYDFSFTRLPILGEIALTYRCNNRCTFCYAGCDATNARLDSPDLDVVELKKIIDIFKHEAKIPFFSFTGGEPTIRPELEELVAYASGLGLKTNLVSNGRLITPQRAIALAAAGLGSAQISIEAPIEALHDELCGIKGSFRQTLAGVKALQDAGIPTQSNTTSLRKNLDVLTQMPAFGRSIGLTRMAFNLFIPTQRSPQNDALFVAYSEMPPVIDGIRKACHAAEVEFLWYSPMPMCIYNTLARGLGNKNCAACDGLISVNPSGDVLPCSSWDESVGNLLRDGFEKTWFSKRAHCIKNKGYASPECQSCGAFAACQSACPLYWNYRGSEELERFGPSFRARYTKRPKTES